MRPHIRGGALLYVSAVRPGESLLGQIVSTGEVMHMVTAENSRSVRTSGTNSRFSDGWTAKKDIRWVVRYVVRP